MREAYLCFLDVGLSRGVHHLAAVGAASNSQRIFSLFLRCCVQQLYGFLLLASCWIPLKGQRKVV